VKKMAYGVLRHRIILNYESIAEGVTPDEVISKMLTLVPIQ
jgi:MoxR-like ATPase